MLRVYTLQTNFASGEVDPQMRMRADITPWRNGLARQRNLRSLLHGGVKTRPPLEFLFDGGTDGRFFVYEFSLTQGYFLHVKATTIDIYFDDGTLAVAGVSHPWGTLAVVRELRMAHSGDTMIFTHEDFQPRILTRTGVASFSISTLAFEAISGGGSSIPFYRYEASSVTLTPSATTGSITITASASIFSAAWIGDRIRHKKKQILITAHTSGTILTGTVEQTLTDTTATVEWDEQAFSTRRGWPRAVSFHDERLCFAGAKNRKGGVWLSKIGVFFNFDVGTGKDDEAIWSGFSGDKVNSVMHLISNQHLLVLTDKSEGYVPQSENRPVTPVNFAVRRQSQLGSLPGVRPVIFDDAVVTAQSFGRVINELTYSDASLAYSADPISTLASHLCNTPVGMDILASGSDLPEKYLFAPMTDGSLAVFHSLRGQKLAAWSRWETDGSFKDIAVVNGRVFALVQRTINAVTKFHIERFRFDVPCNLDSFKTFTSPGSSFAGMAHLQAKSVTIVSNNMVFGTATVPGGGTVTSETATTTTAYVGMPFNWALRTLPPELQDSRGNTLARPKRIVKASINVVETVRFGVEGNYLSVRNVNDDLSLPPNPKTGTYDFTLFGWSKDPFVEILSDVPLPVTILGLSLDVAAPNEA
jgi:hypothetical protein